MEKSKKLKAHQKYVLKDGTIVPGVTTIISSQLGWSTRALIAWARREALAGNDPDKIRDNAADTGTLTHYLVECNIKGEKPYLDDYSKNDIDRAETGYLAYLEWVDKNNVEYLASEMQVISEKYRYGGTIDIIAKKDKSMWLIDIKTSKGIYPNHKIQVAAYKKAYEEQEGKEINQCHIIKLSKDDGSFEHHIISDEQVEAGWEAFQHCLELYKLQKLF